MNRKQFVKFSAFGTALTATGGLSSCTNNTSTKGAALGVSAAKAIYVPNGQNRFKEQLKIWGVIPYQVKVSGKDTEGSYFVFEHAKMAKGGPPRHFHYEQDEWFYALHGEFTFEVGDEKFLLRPGDSLFAPRIIPHVWAYTGDEPGTLLLAVQPAGSLEEFFAESCGMTSPPTAQEAEQLFAAHGMKVTGPPLIIS